MRLTAANVGHGFRIEGAQVLHRPVNRVRRAVGQQVAGWKVGGAGGTDGVRTMEMLGHLRLREGVRRLAASFAEGVCGTHVNRRAGLQVWQREVDSTIATERRPEQGKQRLILVDGQQLPVAQSPSFRRKTETHNPDFGQKRFSHPLPLLT